MKLINKSKDTQVAQELALADNPLSRMIGLLGRKKLLDGEALLIKPCNAVHTFFMRFSIDVIFASKENKVIKVIKDLRPFRITPVYFNALFVIEVPSGTAERTHTQEGDILCIEY